MQYFQEDIIEKTLLENGPAYLEYVRERLTEHALGLEAWVKPKVIYDDPIHPNQGDIRSMTCFTNKVKVVKIISTNPIRKKHFSISVGATLLLDYEENHPLAVFEATAMSGIRTAAMAIVGTQFAGYDLDDVLIIGRGRVGTYMMALLESLGHTPRTYDLLDESTGFKMPHYKARVVFVATDSKKAFLFPENCEADFIVSVGADTHFNFELTPELIEQRGGLFVDCFDAKEVGDLHLMHDPDIRGNIVHLYHAGQNKNEPIRTLISVGSPLMDALTVEYLSDKLL